MTVVRTGGGLRMILNTKSGVNFVPNPFNRLVVEIDVSDFNIIRQSGCIDRKAMIL